MADWRDFPHLHECHPTPMEAACPQFHQDVVSPPPDLIRVPEAARRLGVSSETLYRQIRAGNFPPAVHIGAAIRISVPRLEAYLHGPQASA
jgi:excisionase family DNA binding protein